MTSERTEGDRHDKREAGAALVNMNWKCRTCGFLMRDWLGDKWPECPYHRSMMKPFVEPLDATKSHTGGISYPAEGWTITSRRKLSERIYWAFCLLFRWPKKPVSPFWQDGDNRP